MLLRLFRQPASQPASQRNFDATTVSLLTIYQQLPEEQRQIRFVSTEAVAVRYELSQRTVQRWIKKRMIVAVPVGKKYHVDLLSLTAFLEKLAEERALL